MDSEFRVYPYILEVLKKLEWDTRNPARGGQVYTQGEFRRHNPLLAKALGQKAPENIIVISWQGGPVYWVVEAKRRHQDNDLALAQAKGYGDLINQRAPSLARFATGIAGTPESSFYVSTSYWDGERWSEVAINNYETTGFLTPEQCVNILGQNNPRILDLRCEPRSVPSQSQRHQQNAPYECCGGEGSGQTGRRNAVSSCRGCRFSHQLESQNISG